jgi:oligopeptide transport system substrate-binding protein
MKKIWLRFFFFGFLGLGLLGFHQLRQGRPNRVALATAAGVLLVGNGSEPATLDPHLATGSPEHHVFDALFEGLVAHAAADPDACAPGVALSWESADFITWDFQLRPEACWSDGTALTAEDFVFSFQRILSADLLAEYAEMLHLMRGAREFHEGLVKDFRQVGVQALGPHRLRITLNGPAPYFPAMLKHYAWFPVPRHVILKHGAMAERDTQWTQQRVSNGPFQLAEWRYNHSIQVRPNPHYWDAARVRLRGITFYPITSDATEERAFLDNQLHITQTIPLNTIQKHQRERPQCLRQEPLLGTYFYRLNVTQPPLNDLRVRQALTLAVDRQTLVQSVLRGGQQVCTGFTPPATLKGYATPQSIRFDPALARKQLAEAGFPDGRGFPKVEILINTQEAHRTVAEAIQAMWRQHLGISVGISNQDWGVYLESQKKLDYDVCRAGWIGDYPDPFTFLGLWQTGNANNQTGWGHPRYDELIQRSQRESNPQRRLQLMAEAEALLLEQLPVLPLYWYTRSYLMRPEVKNWVPSAMEHHCYKAMELRGP